ncbi:hypothetical protein ACGFI9_34660 [Micromonospora sp. NPDC048930]|uniref:hypothetical protein n=1 Tax=Micromonospora sp. NPDC048930 TaxID=3364261 RepID=UPI0037180A86
MGSRLWWWRELLVGLLKPRPHGADRRDADHDPSALTPQTVLVPAPARLPTVCVDNLVVVFPEAQEAAAAREAARLRLEGRRVVETRMSATELAMLAAEDPSVTVEYRH